MGEKQLGKSVAKCINHCYNIGTGELTWAIKWPTHFRRGERAFELRRGNATMLSSRSISNSSFG